MDGKGNDRQAGPEMFRFGLKFGDGTVNPPGPRMGDADRGKRRRRLEFHLLVQFAVNHPIDHIAEIFRPAVGAVGFELRGFLRGDPFFQQTRGQGVKPGALRIEIRLRDPPDIAASGVHDQDIGLPDRPADLGIGIDLGAVIPETDLFRQFQVLERIGEKFRIGRRTDEHHIFRRQQERKQQHPEQQRQQTHGINPPARRSWNRLRGGKLCRGGCRVPLLPRGSS